MSFIFFFWPSLTSFATKWQSVIYATSHWNFGLFNRFSEVLLLWSSKTWNAGACTNTLILLLCFSIIAHRSMILLLVTPNNFVRQLHIEFNSRKSSLCCFSLSHFFHMQSTIRSSIGYIRVHNNLSIKNRGIFLLYKVPDKVLKFVGWEMLLYLQFLFTLLYGTDTFILAAVKHNCRWFRVILGLLQPSERFVQIEPVELECHKS